MKPQTAQGRSDVSTFCTFSFRVYYANAHDNSRSFKVSQGQSTKTQGRGLNLL